ncbi:hypothetical protein DPSP01_006538 [Paraphaeosphaeria sporulosa]
MTTQYLTNSYLGPAYSLQPNHSSSITSGVHCAPSRNGGLLWTLVPTPEDPTKFNICTTDPQSRQPKCLDIYNDNSSDRTRVRLADPGHYAGQMWTLISQREPGYFKLSNDWTGEGWYLDTYSDSYEAFMSQGDATGQYWAIQGVGSGSGAHTVPVQTYDDNHHHCYDQAGKIAGGAAAGYLGKKLWKKLT